MMLKKRSSDRRLAKRQAEFIECVEGIGDILVFETRMNRAKTVIKGLRSIESLLEEFFRIKRDDPERFEKLLVSQQFSELWKKEPDEAGFRMTIEPEKHLLSFSTVVTQLMRVHQAALESRNDEISRQATYHVVYLLADLAREPENDLYVKLLLQRLAEISERAIGAGDRSWWSATAHWYMDIVFRGLGRSGGDFELTYLPVFNDFFFSSLRRVVDNNSFDAFKPLVSCLHHGGVIGLEPANAIWEYAHILLDSNISVYSELNDRHDLEKKTQGLYDSQQRLFRKQELDTWIRDFEALKAVLAPHFGEKLQDEAKEKEEQVREGAVTWFQQNNLIEVLLELGAYCLFKNRPEFIACLWEFKHPTDADAVWSGPDIVPQTLGRIVDLYFREGFYERSVKNWEGHHGVEVYFNKYFLLLLLNIIGVKRNARREDTNVDQFVLPVDRRAQFYSSIEYQVDRLLPVADKLRNDREALEVLGFDLAKLDKSFDEELIPFLKHLICQAQERLKSHERKQPPSPRIIEEFSRDLTESFRESAVLRSVFEHYGLYQDRTGEQRDNLQSPVGRHFVIEKAAFFEDWPVSYGNLGRDFGRGFALGEDAEIARLISSGCTPVKRKSLAEVLSAVQAGPKTIVLVSAMLLPNWRRNQPDFRSKWHADIEQLGVVGFQGCLVHKNAIIPVFEIRGEGTEQLILVLNTAKLGILEQQSPLGKGEEDELKTGVLRINVRAYSEDPELTKRELANPPKYLREKGDVDAQRAYLQSHVLIEIGERIRFLKHREFEGYRLES